jgi:hypothetical protein
MTYGATDDYGTYAVEDRMHIHDLHATILHILGWIISGSPSVWRPQFRLTDVAGQVALEISPRAGTPGAARQAIRLRHVSRQTASFLPEMFSHCN